MMLLIAPVAGLAFGFAVGRWPVLWLAAGVLLAGSAAAFALGLLHHTAWEPSGGLVAIVMFFELPGWLCVGIGVWAREARDIMRPAP